MTESLRIVAISDESELQALASDWDQLIRTSRAFSPMLTYAWVSSFFQQRVRSGRRWACLCAYRDEKLVGLLPLVLGNVSQLGMEFETASYPHDDTTPHGDIIVHDDFVGDGYAIPSAAGLAAMRVAASGRDSSGATPASRTSAWPCSHCSSSRRGSHGVPTRSRGDG